MHPKAAIYALMAAAIGLSTNQANAMDLGEFEYRNSCAQCHGEDAKGGGPISHYLVDPAPDLTLLAKNNGGVFPVKEMAAIVEGTADIGVHGRDMPLWGDRYRERAALIGDDTADFPFDPATDSDRYAKARILAVIEYLSTVQVE